MKRLIVGILFCLTVMFYFGSVTAYGAKHHAARPHHAHLIKHPHVVAATVHIPASAYRKAILRPRKAKKSRRR